MPKINKFILLVSVDVNLLANFLIMNIFHKYIILLFLLSGNTYSQQYSLPVSFDLSNFLIEKSDSFPLVQFLDNPNTYFINHSGYPELPYIPIYILMPHNSKINKIAAKIIDFKDVSDPDFAQEEIKIDNSRISIDFPSSSILFDSAELFAGFQINKIHICPFRYLPETHQLFFCSELLLDIQYLMEEKPLKYELSEDKIKVSREFIRELVINKEKIDQIFPLEEKIDYSVIQIYKENEGDTVEVKKEESIPLRKEEKGEPFHIKRLKTN